MSKEKQFTYRNKSGVTQTLMGIGVVEAGKTVSVNEPIQNPNFELVDGGKQYHSESERRRVEASNGDAAPAQGAK